MIRARIMVVKHQKGREVARCDHRKIFVFFLDSRVHFLKSRVRTASVLLHKIVFFVNEIVENLKSREILFNLRSAVP